LKIFAASAANREEEAKQMETKSTSAERVNALIFAEK